MTGHGILLTSLLKPAPRKLCCLAPSRRHFHCKLEPARTPGFSCLPDLHNTTGKKHLPCSFPRKTVSLFSATSSRRVFWSSRRTLAPKRTLRSKDLPISKFSCWSSPSNLVDTSRPHSRGSTITCTLLTLVLNTFVSTWRCRRKSSRPRTRSKPLAPTCETRKMTSSVVDVELL